MVAELDAGRAPATPWLDEEDEEFDRLLDASSAGKPVVGEPVGSAPHAVVRRLQRQVFSQLRALEPAPEAAVVATAAETAPPTAAATAFWTVTRSWSKGEATSTDRRRATDEDWPSETLSPTALSAAGVEFAAGCRMHYSFVVEELRTRLAGPDFGVRRSTLRQWHRGRSTFPGMQPDRFLALEQALDVVPESLLARLDKGIRGDVRPLAMAVERLLQSERRAWLWHGLVAQTTSSTPAGADSRVTTTPVDVLVRVTAAGQRVHLPAEVKSRARISGARGGVDSGSLAGPVPPPCEDLLPAWSDVDPACLRTVRGDGGLHGVFIATEGNADGRFIRHLQALPRAMVVFVMWKEPPSAYRSWRPELGIAEEVGVRWPMPGELDWGGEARNLIGRQLRSRSGDRRTRERTAGELVDLSCRCRADQFVRLRRKDHVVIVDRAIVDETRPAPRTSAPALIQTGAAPAPGAVRAGARSRR